MSGEVTPEVTALAINVAVPEALRWTDTRRGEDFTLTTLNVRLLGDGRLAAKAYGRPTGGGRGTYVSFPVPDSPGLAALVAEAASRAGALWTAHRGLGRVLGCQDAASPGTGGARLRGRSLPSLPPAWARRIENPVDAHLVAQGVGHGEPPLRERFDVGTDGLRQGLLGLASGHGDPRASRVPQGEPGLPNVFTEGRQRWVLEVPFDHGRT
jgi:hypothetical protein